VKVVDAEEEGVAVAEEAAVVACALAVLLEALVGVVVLSALLASRRAPGVGVAAVHTNMTAPARESRVAHEPVPALELKGMEHEDLPTQAALTASVSLRKHAGASVGPGPQLLFAALFAMMLVAHAAEP